MTVTDLPQKEVLRQIRSVCFPDAKSILDVTYGGGGFWDDEDQPTCGADINPERALNLCADYHVQPFRDGAFDLVIFDPPFQPHTASREKSKVAKRFTLIEGGVEGVKLSVQAGAMESYRVARLGLIVKVQDYIHSHKPVWMSSWIWDVLGEPYDFCMVKRPSKIRASNWTTQKSVWRNHSTFWVYRKTNAR